jgi:hypothetical protein
MRAWLGCAASGPVVRRAATAALVVGPILIAINHSDAITSGHISAARLGRMALTFVVPYIVSTWSSIQAARRPAADDARTPVELHERIG